jgi:hypothetical protein
VAKVEYAIHQKISVPQMTTLSTEFRTAPMMTKSATFAVLVASTLLLSSCTKHRQLEAEQAELHAKHAELVVQLSEVDLKLKGLPDLADAASILQEAEQKRKEAAERVAEVTARLSKWKVAEDTLKGLQERVSAYSTSTN